MDFMEMWFKHVFQISVYTTKAKTEIPLQKLPILALEWSKFKLNKLHFALLKECILLLKKKQAPHF